MKKRTKSQHEIELDKRDEFCGGQQWTPDQLRMIREGFKGDDPIPLNYLRGEHLN